MIIVRDNFNFFMQMIKHIIGYQKTCHVINMLLQIEKIFDKMK